MQPTVTPRQMQTLVDVHHFDLTDADRRRIEDDLDGFERQIENFPVADLHSMDSGSSQRLAKLLTPAVFCVTPEGQKHIVSTFTVIQRSGWRRWHPSIRCAPHSSPVPPVSNFRE